MRESETFNLDPDRSVRYTNVLASVFGLDPGSYGALLIHASDPALHAIARVANNPAGGGAGTFGQAMPAVRADDFTASGERRRLLFGTHDDDMRFNVGCVTIAEEGTVVNLEVFAADGTHLASEILSLSGRGNDQVNRVFSGFGQVTGFVDYWSVLPSRVYCYGSLLDNVTSDPTTVPPF